ncbi:9121_t:CDS:2 [Dentiscutata heterogama]|uniref:9121_t:CDS:1 n=1 Tax=Dentiscutata heterogama TaxID=1316150 RepID=A0ACA9KAL1_9GLOM|nr:9121_t:CDS:2 [Dentiscutata heterogama]
MSESVPLLETREDLHNLIDCKEQFWLIFCSSSATNLPTDVSKIPYEYRLRCKSFWICSYVIEGYITEFNNETNSASSTKADNSNQPEFIKYAEIISDPVWKYVVIEFRYFQNGTEFPVLTVTSRIVNHFTNEIEIVFTASNDNDLDLKSCKYRISWTWWFNGFIWRLCENANETDFKKIAFFKGSPGWGLTFSSVDRKINYGYSTKSTFFWDLHKKDIFIDRAAPFPPAIPALYAAYYDYLESEPDYSRLLVVVDI